MPMRTPILCMGCASIWAIKDEEKKPNSCNERRSKQWDNANMLLSCEFRETSGPQMDGHSFAA